MYHIQQNYFGLENNVYLSVMKFNFNYFKLIIYCTQM